MSAGEPRLKATFLYMYNLGSVSGKIGLDVRVDRTGDEDVEGERCGKGSSTTMGSTSESTSDS